MQLKKHSDIFASCCMRGNHHDNLCILLVISHLFKYLQHIGHTLILQRHLCIRMCRRSSHSIHYRTGRSCKLKVKKKNMIKIGSFYSSRLCKSWSIYIYPWCQGSQLPPWSRLVVKPLSNSHEVIENSFAEYRYELVWSTNFWLIYWELMHLWQRQKRNNSSCEISTDQFVNQATNQSNWLINQHIINQSSDQSKIWWTLFSLCYFCCCLEFASKQHSQSFHTRGFETSAQDPPVLSSFSQLIAVSCVWSWFPCFSCLALWVL